MAEKKRAVSYYTAGWNIEEAKKLIEECRHLNPRPTVIFVRPSANRLAAAFAMDRQKKAFSYARARADPTPNMNVEPQRRKGRIELTEEDCK